LSAELSILVAMRSVYFAVQSYVSVEDKNVQRREEERYGIRKDTTGIEWGFIKEQNQRDK
jgi:hypothetical protein